MEWNAIDGSGRVWSGMVHYLRELNAIECNRMLGRVSGTVTSGMEHPGMVMECNRMWWNGIECCGMVWNVTQ